MIIRVFFILYISVIFISGCETSEKQSSCSMIESKLRSCNMLTDGDYCIGAIEDLMLDCTANCINKLTCGELTQYSCTTDLDDWKQTCLSECIGYFSCSNGLEIPLTHHCNGVSDCNDGSDEVGCKIYVCYDGEEITEPNPECNGFEDCSDGSNEQNCPSFNCNDNSTIPALFQCDGKEDCSDGSDEQSCPVKAELICIT